MNTASGIRFEHLDRLSDHRGLFEHAAGTLRREEHGYCTDDNARLLVVTSRQPGTDAARRLGRLALDFVLAAQGVDGRCHNRMDPSGRWIDQLSTEDCWGRSIWGLGITVAHHTDPLMRAAASRGFDRAVCQRSRWPRAMAFAVLGAADVLARDPTHATARELIVDAVATIGTLESRQWPWPEPRLTYANAALAEAVVAAGAALDSAAVLDQGLTMLGWLLELETPHGHLSVSGDAGRGPNVTGPLFDQQPIEVAAMADACWRALNVTGDHAWSRGIAGAADWFAGANDTGLVMFDVDSGGGFDGLHRDRVNLNQGAESTLAFISTMQRAQSLAMSS